MTEARDKTPEQIVYRLGLAAPGRTPRGLAQAEKILDDCQSQIARQRLAAPGPDAVPRGPLRKGRPATLRKPRRTHRVVFQAADRLQLLSGLLNYALQINDSQFVDSLSKEIEDQLPNDVRIRQMTFERALAAGDSRPPRRRWRSISGCAGQNYYWYYGQAVLLCQRARSDKNPAADPGHGPGPAGEGPPIAEGLAAAVGGRRRSLPHPRQDGPGDQKLPGSLEDGRAERLAG